MIFFILYPINPVFGLERTNFDVEELKSYLQKNSFFISQYPELLAYFALPYIPNPVDHPNFCDLFTTNWVKSLKHRVLECTKAVDETPTTLETIFSQNLIPAKKSLYMSRSSSDRIKPSIFEPEMTFAPKDGEKPRFDLNFASISYDLNNLADETQLCALLQALRWKITQSDPEDSEAFLAYYVKNNILSTIKPHDSLLDHLLTSTKKVKEYSLKLINVIAYRKLGRDYLLNKENLIPLTLRILYTEKNKTTLRQTCLSLIQKLSVRKTAQVSMINNDMIRWILKVIKKDINEVDEEMIEFCTGILMNLSIRSAAKEKLEELESELLHTISKYLNFKNLNITKYIYCLLYTLLSYERFRALAKKLGIDRVLRSIKNTSEDSMKKEIELILEQIEVNEDNNVSLVSEIDTDDTYIVLDADIDDLITDPKVLKGNELLKHKYEYRHNYDNPVQNVFLSKDKIPRTPYN
jgi:hypothetical protein